MEKYTMDTMLNSIVYFSIHGTLVLVKVQIR